MSFFVSARAKTGKTYEKLVLSTLLGVFCLEESETDEKTTKDIQNKFREKVRRVPPSEQHIPFDKLAKLIQPSRCEFRMIGSGNWRSMLSIFVNLLNRVLNDLSLGSVPPYFVPVAVSSGSSASTNHIEHKFSTKA